MTGWETKTGNAWTTDIKMVKTPSAINNTTPTQPYPNGTNVDVNAVTHGTYSTTGRTVTATFTTGFSGFGVGNPGTPPPFFVTYISFSGKNIDNYNLLEWRTESEGGISFFSLERAIKNEQAFQEIAQIPAQGGVSFGTDYQYKDANILSNTIYQYRLKTIDASGELQYSNVIEIATPSIPLQVEIFPNPTKDDATLNVTLPQEDNIIVTFWNSAGQKVKTLQWKQLSKGKNALNLPTKELASGNYVIQIRLEKAQQTLTQKFLRQ